jgi:hypothetical protein
VTTTQIPVLAQVDEALDEIQRLRERIMAQPSSADRFARLAELAESEALWWLLLFEHSRTRVHWRAALSAHEHARQSARRWRLDAAARRSHDAGGRSRRGVA